MKRGYTAILAATLVATLLGCDNQTEFEKFAYEGCLAEGKHQKAICACNAKNLDKSLNEEEKSTYKKATVGDFQSAINLMGIMGKLQKAVLDCVK